MNINPTAAAAIAGVSRAASRGGESDNRSIEATGQQAKADAPAGKTSETTVDAGDQTQDRGGDGRQLLDVFERHEQQEAEEPPEEREETSPPSEPGSGEHLDLQG